MPEHDPDAEFVALLTEHQAAIRYYVASLLPGDPSADDVAQLANTTIWKKRADFELGTNFKAWVFSIARYEVLNYRKTQARDSRLVFSDELIDIFAEEIPDEAADLDQRQQALRSCLGNLKSSERDLILHRYYEDMSLQEYGDRIGRSVGGLKVSLHRVRNKLLACITSKLNFEEALT
ncbi:MAG: sigma-70 family RNA polymerase sigma factor [Verrucomicrobiota bacterium]